MAPLECHTVSPAVFAPRGFILRRGSLCELQQCGSRRRQKSCSLLSFGHCERSRNKLEAYEGGNSCLPVSTTFRKLGLGTCHRWQRKRTVTMAMVAPDSGSILYGVLAACAAIGQAAETRTTWGGRVSAPLLAMGVGMALSGAQIIPSAAPAYDSVFSVVMPMAVALSLLETDVTRAFTDAGSTLKAFAVGAVGTVLGTVIAFWLVGGLLGPDGWKIASCLCSSYVGGSLNYAATAQALGLTSGSTLAAGMAADNVAMAAYFSIIMAIPDDAKPDPKELECEGSAPSDSQPTVETVATSVAVAAASCILGNSIAALLPPSFAGSGLAIMAVVASLFSALGGKLSHAREGASIPLFAGSQTLGGALMLLFFSVIGASSSLGDAVAGGWPLVAFILTLIVVHLGVILGVGRLLRLPIRTVLVASNANIGGPGTAAAMANARSWQELVRPAVLVGTLGYTVGTVVGCLVGVRLLQPMS